MDTERLFSSPTIAEAVARAFVAFGDRPAVSLGDETWTYHRLGRAIRAAQSALAAAAGPVLYAPANSPQAVATIFGAIAAGRVPVLPDPTWTDGERAEVARRCAIRTVLAESALTAPWLTGPRRLDTDGDLFFHDVAFPDGAPDDVAPRPTTAVCRFTSGTTGFSRCLEFTDAAVLAAAWGFWDAVRYRPDDVVLCLATLNNGLAFNTSLLTVLLAGAHLVFHRGPLIPSALAATTRRFQPTALVAFPFVYDALAAGCHRLDATRLRLALSSAAPLKPESAAPFLAGHGVPVCNYYGLVEAGPCTFNDGHVLGSVGKRLAGVDFKILPGADGEAGRLCVRSAAMASGFLDRRGPSLATLLDDDGYYVTSDLADLHADGHLILRGRIGRLMNIEGRKVDPREVETVIRSVGGVTDAVVRDETASGRVLIAAYVESGSIAPDKLRAVLCAHLAPYKRPQRIRVLPRFPRSAAGKVLIGQLAAGDL
jgi:long-chain acyl-CoA synthetase